MKLGVMCSGNGTNFENIVTNPICKEHEVVLMIHNKKKCGDGYRLYLLQFFFHGEGFLFELLFKVYFFSRLNNMIF